MNDGKDKNSSLFEKFENINNTLSIMKTQMHDLQKDMKDIEKHIKKQMKSANKKVKPKEIKKRSPSGFAKPIKVTNQLCEFMNRPIGTELARTEVTKTLVQYIKDNELQKKNSECKNKITPDEKLTNLLGINDEEASDLTFFNIQKYMNKHFKPNLEQCK